MNQIEYLFSVFSEDIPFQALGSQHVSRLASRWIWVRVWKPPVSLPILHPFSHHYPLSLLSLCLADVETEMPSVWSRVQLSRAGMDFGDLHLNLDGIEDGPGICRQGRPPTPPFYSFDLLTVLSENMCVMLCPEQSRTLGQ